MDQIKIGKFISEQRKKNNLTQMQLAEKLNITDRAISKWENGKAMPDSSIMLDLCNELKITVNELLCGEVINMDCYNKMAEENLLKMAKQKENMDRQMLKLEWGIGFSSSIMFFMSILIASYIDMQMWTRILIIAWGIITFFIGIHNCLRIEQKAGYYECAKCHHKYIPKYESILFSKHMGRSRYMRCPECNQKSWNKKVIN